MTHPAITRLRELSDKATKLPWEADVHPGGVAAARVYTEGVKTDNRYKHPQGFWHGETICSKGNTSEEQHRFDMRYIAESRNALPVLLDCLEMALSSLDGIAKDDEDHSEYRKCCEFQDKADITVKAITAKLNTLKGGSDE